MFFLVRIGCPMHTWSIAKSNCLGNCTNRASGNKPLIDDLPTNATTNNHSRHLKPMCPTKCYHAQDELFVFPNMFFSRLTPMRTWYVLPPIWRSMKSLKGMQPGTPPGDWKSSKPSDHFSAQSHGFKVPKHLGNPHMMIHIKTMTIFGSFRTWYFGMSLIRSSLNVWSSFLSFR